MTLSVFRRVTGKVFSRANLLRRIAEADPTSEYHGIAASQLEPDDVAVRLLAAAARTPFSVGFWHDSTGVAAGTSSAGASAAGAGLASRSAVAIPLRISTMVARCVRICDD